MPSLEISTLFTQPIHMLPTKSFSVSIQPITQPLVPVHVSLDVNLTVHHAVHVVAGGCYVPHQQADR